MANRLVWADAAKGLSIILVVLWHTTDKHLGAVSGQLGSSTSGGVWESISLYLTPARMPLFFLISGMFAASAIKRSWQDMYRRPANYYYVYVVWLILSVPFAVMVGSLAENPIDGPRDVIEGLFFGATGPWYMFALAVFLVGAKLFLRVPHWITILLSLGTAYLAFSGTFGGPGNFHYVMENAFFFLVGAYYPGVVRWVAEKSRWFTVAPAFVVAFTLGWLVTLGDLPAFPLVRFGAAVIGSAALLGVVVCLSRRVTFITRFLVWVGQRTLGTYLLHGKILALWQLILISSSFTISDYSAELLGAFYTPIVVGLAAGGAILLTYMLTKIGLGFLFAMPGRLGVKKGRPGAHIAAPDRTLT